MGLESFWESWCSRFGHVFGSVCLPVFLAICGILKLEAAISIALQYFEVQHFDAGTVHVTW